MSVYLFDSSHVLLNAGNVATAEACCCGGVCCGCGGLCEVMSESDCLALPGRWFCPGTCVHVPSPCAEPTHHSGTIDVSYSASDGSGGTLDITTIGPETFNSVRTPLPIATSGNNILVVCSYTGTFHNNATLSITIQCRSDGWYISFRAGTSSEGCGPNVNWATGDVMDSFVKYAELDCNNGKGTFFLTLTGDPDSGGWTGGGSGSVNITIT